MIDSKLTFRIQEIREGKSERNILLEPGDLEFDQVTLVRAEINVEFEKTRHFINVDFTVAAALTVTCDRSLEEFEKRVHGSYEILFKPEVEAISESENSKVKQFNVRDLTLSIDKEVRDTILLELPIKILHPRFLDSKGNPVEFGTKTFGDRGPEEEKPVDPRWEALRKLKN